MDDGDISAPSKERIGKRPSELSPLCILSNFRKIIEKAVTAELETEIGMDRMQFGFQRDINTLQAALDIAAMIESKFGQLLAVLDLAKAYDKVIRQLLVDKLTKHGVPTNIINQLIVFLLLLLARTVGYVKETIAVLTIGLVQGALRHRPCSGS